MISVYPPNEREFADNGLKILKPTKAIVHKVDNGDYYLELKDKIENREYYQSGNIIRVPSPWGKQGFRISKIAIKNKEISIKANHLFYDTQNYVIEDSYVVERNCNDALDHLNMAADTPTPFKTISDVPTIHSYRCVRKTLGQAISGVVKRWGGHLVRDNWKIEIRSTIGQDRGVSLNYGKNIIHLKASENWDKVCTKVLPVGKDGLLLPEVWVSYGEELYDIPYTKIVSFAQGDIKSEDYEDKDQKVDEAAYKEALINNLRIQAKNYLNENCVPKVEYTLEAYIKDVSDVGDTIYVNHPKCKLQFTTNVVSLDYDVILGRITRIEFGNFQSGGLKDLVKSIDSKIDEKVVQSIDTNIASLRRELTEATNAIRDKLGESYVIYDGDRILVVDKLPKEEAVNVIMINSGGIGFSQTGINGIFNSAWSIDGTLDMQQVNVINLVCDMIKGGVLKLGSNLNQSGVIELYDQANTLICQVDMDGITMFCKDGRTIKINADEGFVGYASDGTKIYWVSQKEFHMKRSVVEDEITIANGLRFIPINTDTNQGIGIVAMA